MRTSFVGMEVFKSYFFQTVKAASLTVALYTAVWMIVLLVRTSQHCVKTVRKLWHAVFCSYPQTS